MGTNRDFARCLLPSQESGLSSLVLAAWRGTFPPTTLPPPSWFDGGGICGICSTHFSTLQYTRTQPPPPPPATTPPHSAAYPAHYHTLPATTCPLRTPPATTHARPHLPHTTLHTCLPPTFAPVTTTTWRDTAPAHLWDAWDLYRWRAAALHCHAAPSPWLVDGWTRAGATPLAADRQHLFPPLPPTAARCLPHLPALPPLPTPYPCPLPPAFTLPFLPQLLPPPACSLLHACLTFLPSSL